MSMQDPLADMLVRIKNAQQRIKPLVSMPSSNLKVAVAKVMQKEGYIQGYRIDNDTEATLKKPILTIDLKYYQGKAVISELNRISKPSLRSYSSFSQLPKIRGGLGVSVVSTSKGVMTDRQARHLRVGGELLCTIF